VEEMKIFVVQHEGVVTTIATKHKEEMELVSECIETPKYKFFKM
jgi:hypothetical protein